MSKHVELNFNSQLGLKLNMSSIIHQLTALLLVLCMSRIGSAIRLNLSPYCKTDHCGMRNVACVYKEKITSTCSGNTQMVDMGQYKNMILHSFNIFRNKVALGYTSTMYPAGRMARMTWSQELEKFARMFVKRCEFHLVPCMSSPQFTTIGYIFDGLSYTGEFKPHNVPEMTEEMMNAWFEDARFVTKDLLLSLTNDFSKPTVRNAVLLMADRNTHVGCSGVSRTFTSGKFNQFNLVCTFATDNMIHKPIYKAWAKAGDLCKSRDKIYLHLCAIGEPYNNNHKYKPGELLTSETIE